MNIYIQNKYTHWYYNIINAAKARPLTEDYMEEHHIIPRSLGGTNDKENLVLLTAREHFVVHHLLTKMLNGNSKYKMYVAYWCMANYKDIRVTNRQYEKGRRLQSEAITEMWKDPNSTFNSEQYRLNKSISSKKSQSSKEYREKRSNMAKNWRSDPNSKYNTDEYRLKQSIAQKQAQNRPEVLQKLFEKNAKEYMVTNPEGISFKIKGLAKFCKENKLCLASMSNVSNNKKSNYKGWICKKI
jgi:hypothetical protein